MSVPAATINAACWALVEAVRRARDAAGRCPFCAGAVVEGAAQCTTTCPLGVYEAARAGRLEPMLKASELAEAFQVDLKTIHNWVDRGHLVSFTTPGRHLRFRRADVLAFARAQQYPAEVLALLGGAP